MSSSALALAFAISGLLNACGGAMSLAPVERLVGIEVYPRSAHIPLDLPMRNTECGAIAFWTGSRAKPNQGRR